MVLVIGGALGPSALASARAAQPPIDWHTVPFVLVGCFIGTVFVIGIQILRREPKYGRRALGFFMPVSMFALGSGLAALITGAIQNELGPASFLFVSVGIGLIMGVLLSGVAYRVKFKNEL
ncbi:MAG: hypothetical protein ACFFCW_42515 [Candidatus Hodarchaeota archaeon]